MDFRSRHKPMNLICSSSRFPSLLAAAIICLSVALNVIFWYVCSLAQLVNGKVSAPGRGDTPADWSR
jgi:hypothetical protein